MDAQQTIRLIQETNTWEVVSIIFGWYCSWYFWSCVFNY
jgi:hypothetical protein